MIRMCLVGCGNMGSHHFRRYMTLAQEQEPVRLVGVCDLERRRFDAALADAPDGLRDIRFYDDFAEMMAKEAPDAVDICLPDSLHCEYAVRAMAAGAHVLCEKPMALDEEQAARMTQAARQYGRELMIAHCCRFAEPYIRLKSLAEGGTLGRPRMAGFYRMSGVPRWSWNNWLLREETSGGCLIDMHIHDIDILQWIFGMPEALCAQGFRMIPGSGVDALSAQYRYDGLIASASSSWCMLGEGVPFSYGYEVAFEKGSVFCRDGVVSIYREGMPPEIDAEAAKSDGYLGEIRYFVQALEEKRPIREATGPDSARAVRIARAELDSIEKGGIWREV